MYSGYDKVTYVGTELVGRNFTSFVPLHAGGGAIRLLFYDGENGRLVLYRLEGLGAAVEPWEGLPEQILGTGYTHFWHLTGPPSAPVLWAYSRKSGDLVTCGFTEYAGLSTLEVRHNLGAGWTHITHYIDPLGVALGDNGHRMESSGWVCYDQATGKSEIHHYDFSQYSSTNPQAGWTREETWGLQPGLSSLVYLETPRTIYDLAGHLLTVHKEGRVWYLWPESAPGPGRPNFAWWPAVPRKAHLPPGPVFDPISGWNEGWSDSWSRTQNTNNDPEWTPTERYTQFLAITKTDVFAYNPSTGEARVDHVYPGGAEQANWQLMSAPWQRGCKFGVSSGYSGHNLFRYRPNDGQLDINIVNL